MSYQQQESRKFPSDTVSKLRKVMEKRISEHRRNHLPPRVNKMNSFTNSSPQKAENVRSDDSSMHSPPPGPLFKQQNHHHHHQTFGSHRLTSTNNPIRQASASAKLTPNSSSTNVFQNEPEHGKNQNSGNRYLIPAASHASLSFELDVQGSPIMGGNDIGSVRKENEELRQALRLYKLRLQQAELHLKKQKRWLMELNQIRDNINLIRTSQQQPTSQDTSMQLRSPIKIGQSHRQHHLNKLLSFSQRDDQNSQQPQYEDSRVKVNNNHEIQSMMNEINQTKERYQKLNSDLQKQRDFTKQMAQQLQQSREAKDRYLNELIVTRKQLDLLKSNNSILRADNTKLQQHKLSLQKDQKNLQAQLIQQETERSFTKADYARKMSQMQEQHSKDIRQLRKNYQKQVLDAKSVAIHPDEMLINRNEQIVGGGGLSKFLTSQNPKSSFVSGGGGLVEQKQDVKNVSIQQIIAENKYLKKTCLQFRSINMLLNTQNRMAIAMLTNSHNSSVQLQNLASALQFVSNSVNSGKNNVISSGGNVSPPRVSSKTTTNISSVSNSFYSQQPVPINSSYSLLKNSRVSKNLGQRAPVHSFYDQFYATNSRGNILQESQATIPTSTIHQSYQQLQDHQNARYSNTMLNITPTAAATNSKNEVIRKMRDCGGIYSSLLRRYNSKVKSPGRNGFTTDRIASSDMKRRVGMKRSGSAYRPTRFISKNQTPLNTSLNQGKSFYYQRRMGEDDDEEDQAKDEDFNRRHTTYHQRPPQETMLEEQNSNKYKRKDYQEIIGNRESSSSYMKEKQGIETKFYPSPPQQTRVSASMDTGSASDVQFAVSELMANLKQEHNINFGIKRVGDFQYCIGPEGRKIQLRVSGNTLYVRIGGGSMDFLEYLAKNNFFVEN